MSDKPFSYGMAIHPYCAVWPEIEGDDWISFVDSIRRNGLHDPITICDGAVLDGKERLRALEELGMEARFVTYTGDDPKAFVKSKNLIRAHWTPEERAEFREKAAAYREKQK